MAPPRIRPQRSGHGLRHRFAPCRGSRCCAPHQLELDAVPGGPCRGRARTRLSPSPAKVERPILLTHEPLGCAALPFLGLVAVNLAHQQIAPVFFQAAPARTGSGVETSLLRSISVSTTPFQAPAARLADAVGVVAVELLQELAVADQPGKPAVADPVQGELHLPCIDGDHRTAFARPRSAARTSFP